MQDKKINTGKLGFAGKMARVFVMNSRLSILLILSIFAWGIFSFAITPKQYNPEIVAPAFNIVTEYPGSSAKEVEEIITKPLESEITDLDGVDDVMSRSMEGGLSMVTVKFHVGEDLEDSKIKLNQKIQSAMIEKPAGVPDPFIMDIDPDDVPVMVMALQSNIYSESALRKIALDLKDELKSVDNTSNIEVHGGRQTEFRISLDPHEMNAKNASLLEIKNAIKTSNVRTLSGELKDAGKAEKILVETDGAVRSIEDLKNIIVRFDGEEPVYLGDLAEISETEEKINSYAELRQKNAGDGSKNAVFLSIAKKKGSNITTVTEDIRNKLSKLSESSLPAGLDVEFVRDEGRTASEEIFGLVINLAQAIFIVSLVLFLFLGKRAAFIVAIAIPLVLSGVFGVGLLYGQTINRITLFALILSLGLLVDNATVVVENAVRHVREKRKKNKKENKQTDYREPVIEAVDEVGAGLLMSTITTLLAFYPMAFVTGMMGPYMGPIPFFVPAALIISLFIAFTINPFLSSVLLREEKEGSKKFKLDFPPIDWIEKKARIMSWKIKNGYKKLLSALFLDKKLRTKVLVGTGLVFFIVMLLPVFGIVKFRMLPKADREQFYVYLDLPEGTHLEKTRSTASELEDFLLRQKNVVSVQSFVGMPAIVDFNGLFKGSSARAGDHYATVKVNLTHHEVRDMKSEDLVERLRPKIYQVLESSPETRIKLIEDPPGPPVMSTVLAKAKGRDYKMLKRISLDLEDMFLNTKGVVDVDNTRTAAQDKVSLRVNYDKASRSGISAYNLSQTMRAALAGVNISALHDSEAKEQSFIFLNFNENFRKNVEDLKLIRVMSRDGRKIPLTEIVEIRQGSIDDIIHRDNEEKTIYVTGEMSGRSVTYATLDLYRKLWGYRLPSGTGEMTDVSFFGLNYLDNATGEEYSIEWGGEWKLTVEVFRDLGMAMMVAIFLIYAVLVAQFHSFRTPILIMITIPLAMIGVLPGFALLGYLKGIYFNATSMIGVIALAGIVVNNAIILVEYLNGFRGKGYTAEEALIETGLTRMRPIILTSLTTILGSLTIAGDPVWAGLAWSIVFGISISTGLTLIVFPVLYYNFQGKEWDCSKPTECESHGPTLA